MALQKYPWGGHQAEHEPAARPDWQGGKWYLWVHWAKYGQQFKGGDPSPVLSVGEAAAGVLDPQYQRDLHILQAGNYC